MIEKPPVVSMEAKLTEKWEAVRTEAAWSIEEANYHLGRIAAAYGNQLHFEDLDGAA
jgi:hypothetical protein